MTTHDAERPHDGIFIPRPVLIAMVALALFAIVSSGVARWLRWGVTREEATATRRVVQFSVAMKGKSAVVATRADGKRIQLVAANQELFPRLIVQGIANIRAREGVPLGAPLILEVAPDGQRMIADPSTRKIVRLAAFGWENGASFDALLS